MEVAAGPYKRPISKSTSDLLSGTETPGNQVQHHQVRDGLLPSANLLEGLRPSTAPYAAKPASSFSPAHKAGFFSALKMRWSRSRSKDRKGRKKGDPFNDQQQKQDGDTSYSTDYAADNSSEHSSSATQSPQHRLLNLQDGASVNNITSESSSMIKRQQVCPLLPLDPTSSPPGPSILIGDEETRKREAALRQHSFFQLKIHLKRGVNLVARDKTGTSDPYVKFKVGGRLLYKSKTVYRDLNPIWDESFTIPIEDPFVPVHIKVFDYDWGLQDDFMGSVYLDLTKLDLGKMSDERLELRDPNKMEYLGEILLSATLIPRSQQEKDALYERKPKVSWLHGLSLSRFALAEIECTVRYEKMCQILEHQLLSKLLTGLINKA